MKFDQNLIESQLSQTYPHTAIVQQNGHVVVFALDSARQFHYTVLTPPDNPDADALLDISYQLKNLSSLDLPANIQSVGNGGVSGNASPTQQAANTPFRALVDGEDIYLYRQSADNKLLMNRYELAGNALQLKKSADGGNEPTQRLEFVQNLQNGRFDVLLLPTSDPARKTWQFFAYNGATKFIDTFNVERSDDGLFDTTPGAHHQPEYALQFDGVNDYVQFVKPLSDVSQQITIEFWSKGGTQLPKQASVLEGVGANSQRMLNIHLPWSDSNIYWDAGRPNAYDRINKGATAADYKGRWTHWAFTKDATAGTMYIYKDGVEWYSGTGKTDDMSGVTLFRLGSYAQSLSHFWNGEIDEVRIWNHARTAADINATMRQRLNGDELGLVGYWNFQNATSTTVPDLTANGNDGTIHGAQVVSSDVPIEPAPAGIDVETTLAFQTDAQYVDCETDINLTDTDFTIEFWAKRSGTFRSMQVAIGHGENQVNNKCLHIGFRSNNRFAFAFYGNDLTTRNVYKNTDWNHWCCVYTHSTKRRSIYHNGRLVIENTASAPYEGTGNFLIGKATWGDNFKGIIDEVRVWKAARTADEIEENLNSRLLGTETDLVAYWRFDEGEGNTARSLTENAHNGTIHGNTNDEMWVTSTAPVSAHTGISYNPFSFIDRTVQSGLAARLDSTSKNVVFAVATGGAGADGNPTNAKYIAALDFDISDAGKLAQIPDEIELPPLTKNIGQTLTDLKEKLRQESSLWRQIADGFVEQKRLTASDPQPDAYFGGAVAISGDWAIVGAYEASPGGVDHAGGAYTLHLENGAWSDATPLPVGQREEDSGFGVSVAISGEWALVGAHEASPGGVDHAGTVHVYHLENDVWVENTTLTATDKQENGHFGVSVAISGERAIIGADTTAADGVENAGVAYIFQLDSGAWSQAKILTAATEESDSGFGSAVAISGDWAFVGAYEASSNGTNYAGNAEVFHLENGAWTHEQTLTAQTPQAQAYFGSSVAVSGEWAVVGASSVDSSGVEKAGSAEIFHLQSNQWTHAAALTASNPQAQAHFGRSVAINGQTALVGADRTNSGSAYVFHSVNGTWQQTQALTDGTEADARFGGAVALSDDAAIVGAYRADFGDIVDAGNASLFASPPSSAFTDLDTAQQAIKKLRAGLNDTAPNLKSIHTDTANLETLGGLLYFATIDGTPYLVDGATGELLWPAQLIRR